MANPSELFFKLVEQFQQYREEAKGRIESIKLHTHSKELRNVRHISRQSFGWNQVQR